MPVTHSVGIRGEFVPVIMISVVHLFPALSLMRQAHHEPFDILWGSQCADTLTLIICSKSRNFSVLFCLLGQRITPITQLFIVCYCCVSLQSSDIWMSATTPHRLWVEELFWSLSFRLAILAAQSGPRQHAAFAFKIKKKRALHHFVNNLTNSGNCK